MIDPIDRNTALGITEECAKTLKWILSDEDLSESERKECEWKLSFAESIISDLKNVPSVMPEPEPCEDAVSRESILSILRENYRRLGLTDKAFMELCSLMKSEPSVTPKRKTGEMSRSIDGSAIIMWLNDWWASSFGEKETPESKAIREVLDKVVEYIESERK